MSQIAQMLVEIETPRVFDEDALAGAELHFEAQRFLNREARLLDANAQRTWLADLVSPDIHYVMAQQQLRYSKDRRVSGTPVQLIFDDDWNVLDGRIRQVETGQQWRADPVERCRRIVTNVEVFATAEAGEYRVLSNCLVARFRRVYEEDIFLFGRDDILRRGDDGQLRLCRRVATLDQRFIDGRNILFFV